MDDELSAEVARQKRDAEELQLSEMTELYGATQWTHSESMSPHHAGFSSGWIAAMRWMKLRGGSDIR